MRPSLRRIAAVLAARNKEFVRDRGALAWNLLFPVLAVFGFAFAFSGRPQDVFSAGVVGSKDALPAGFASTAYVRFIPYGGEAAPLARLRRHQLDMVVAPGTVFRYWINSSSPKGYLLEKIMLGTDAARLSPLRETVEGREIRYVDWLIAGLLGMNIMFSALFGVGYSIVRYRKNGVLKRLKATPLAAFEFLTAQVLSRLLLIEVILVIVYFGSDAVLRFQMHGSYAALLAVFTLGAMCMISLGLLVAARVRSEELAGGLLNLLSWPMMFLSEIWFSLEGAPRPLRLLSEALPLTHVTQAARAVMTEGAGLADVGGHLVFLAAATALFLAAGAAAFEWE